MRIAEEEGGFGILRDVYATDHPELFTDEASLVEAAGSPVFVCQGADTNLKITTAEDFRLAELLLEQGSTLVVNNRGA